MTRVFHYIKRRPLLVCISAWLLSLLSVGELVAFGNMGYFSSAFSPFICFFSLGFSAAALVNLIRAEAKGYSNTKIGLAVTALFLAFVPEVLLALTFLKL